MEDILIPIFICVVLPISIVLINSLMRRNETNRKTEVMLKALESGVEINPEFFKVEQRPRPQRTVKERLLGRLTGASVTSLLGVAALAVSLYFKTGNSELFELADFGIFVAGVLLAVGIALFIVYFVGKKMLSPEIKSEEKAA